MKFQPEFLRLYAVTDRGQNGTDELCRQIEAALSGGVTMLQLREKNLGFGPFLEEAKKVKEITTKYKKQKENIMLLALSGITGVGKSFYAEEIAKKLDFKKVHTIRTRTMRIGEQNGKTGLFMTYEELQKLKDDGKIAYDFDVFGGTYAYKKDEILSNENYVFEMYYTTIQDWKRIRPDIVTIYILPNDINVALEQVKKRNLTPEKENERIKETEEQYKNFMSDKKLQDMFDYIIYNNYDEKSEEELIKLIASKMKSDKY